MPRTPLTNLPKPAWDVEPWQADAACNDTDPELFHFEINERGQRRKARAAKAKQICARCPVLDQCDDFAERTADTHAILGGKTPEERGYNSNTGQLLTA